MRPISFQVRVAREIPGEYVHAADYTVTRYGKTKQHSYHFRNNATGGGTSIQSWNFDAAVTRGDIVRLDVPNQDFRCSPASIATEHEQELFAILAASLRIDRSHRATDAEITQDLRDQIANTGDC